MYKQKKMRLFIFLFCFLIACFSISSNAWSSAFTVTDTYFAISGQLVAPSLDSRYPPGTVLQSFNIVSTQEPISYKIIDTQYPPQGINNDTSWVLASASESSVYLALHAVPKSPEGRGSVISIVDFVPTFNGAGPDITFSGEATYDDSVRPHFTITDLTLNKLIEAARVNPANRPDNVEVLEGTMNISNYAAWDSSHTYELAMFIGDEYPASTNHLPNYYRISTNMLSVPEPPAVLLLSAGLIGLAGYLRKSFS
jgi:hypothetical protein